MSQSYPEIPPGALAEALDARTRTALACGALHGIATEQCRVADGGVAFLVRSVSSLRRKDRERARPAPDAPRPNPFLPPEPALTLGALGPAHLAVLNKYNVLERHLLVVTRAFESQESLLTPDDCVALGRCLAELDALGFYNGGAEAGASQPHKHLQLVPLPLAPAGPSLPIAPLLAAAPIAPGPVRAPGLPFRHRLIRLPAGLWRSAELGPWLHGCYLELLAACGIPGQPGDGAGPGRQSAPYNLLVSRDWLWLVPRAREHWGEISVNALGYAGSLFVRDAAQLAEVERVGPLRLLAGVGLAED